MTQFLAVLFVTLCVGVLLVAISAFISVALLRYQKGRTPPSLLDGLSNEQVQRLLKDIFSDDPEDAGKAIPLPTGVRVLYNEPIAPPALEIGHYLDGCDCKHCANSAEMGGIPMDPFLNEKADGSFYNVGEEETFTPDGREVIALTTPITTCTCAWCREARERGSPELSPTEARANLMEWNAVKCYPIK